ncbi:MAG: DUF2232 domain-containing protein [Actinomycetota bacterium]
MSFDNFGNTNKRLNLFLLALLTFFAAVVALLIPFIGYLGWALMPLPATLLVLAGRKRDGIICALLGILVLFFFDYILPAVILAAILGVAFVYRWLESRNAPPGRYVLYVSLIFVGSGLIYIALVSAISQGNFIGQFINNYRSYIGELENDPLMTRYANIMGMDSAQFTQVIEQTKRVLVFMPYILPGMWAVFMSFAGLLNYAFSSFIGPRYGVRLKKLPPFKSWDLPWYFVWGIILGVIFILLPTFFEMEGTVFYALGANLIIMFGSLYFVLGIAVIWGLFDRFNVQLIWRITVFVVLALFFGLVIIVPVLGLLDIWVNLRRLKRA